MRRGSRLAAPVAAVALFLLGPRLAAEEQPPAGSAARLRHSPAGPVPEAAAPALDRLLAPGRGGLGLDAVLAELDATYPPLAAARRKRDVASGEQLEADGAFDLKLGASAETSPLGKFEKSLARVGVEQPTTLHGATLRGGYSNGADFPSYDGDSVTSRGGELYAGLGVPLLRDGPTDQPRTQRENARLAVRAAELDLRGKRLDARLDATLAYLGWVRAGARERIARDLLEQSVTRQAGVDAMAASGAVAAIEVVENSRLVASRREALRAAERDVELAALKLGLYRRSPAGVPRPPARSELPEGFPRVGGVPPLEEALRRAHATRPDLGRMDLELQQLENQARLAENQLLPRLDAEVKATQDLGAPRPYAPFASTTNATEVTGALRLEFPVQQRKARGKRLQAESKRAALAAERRYLVDSIDVEIRRRAATLAAAVSRLDAAVEAARAADRLEVAEREQLAAGQSTVLLVNLRETASADARARVVDVLEEREAAAAWLLALSATLPQGPSAGASGVTGRAAASSHR